MMKTFKSFKEDVKEPVQPWDPRSEGEQAFKHMHNPIDHKNLVPGVTDQDHVFNGAPRREDPSTASYENFRDDDESKEAYDKGLTTKSNYPEKDKDMKEATLSAKAARAGKDIGKPGKNFDKIAASAAKKYGSKAAGERVAGAILKKMRAHEEIEHLDELTGIKKSPIKKIGYVMKAGKVMTHTAPHEIANNKETERKFKNRLDGLQNLQKRMTKEDLEHLDEADLTKIDRKTLEALTQLHKHYGQKDPRSKASAERGEAELKRRDNEKKEKMKESTLPPHLAKLFNKKGDFKDPKKHAMYKDIQNKMAKKDLGVDAKDHKSEYSKMRASMGVDDKATTRKLVGERTLTPAEMKKREQIAKAMGRENPKMDMSKKMAIATAQAKKISEENIDFNHPNYIGDHANLAKYADKHGSIDKEALHTAAKHMKSGNMDALKKHLRSMDTDPRDKALEYVARRHYATLGYRMKGMKEEVEQIDEISTKTLVSYGSKAQKQVKGNQPSDPDKLRKRTNREQGIKLAFNKHYQFKAKVPATEEVEYVDEKLSDEAKKHMQAALGPKTKSNAMRKTSAGARALIGMAKKYPKNMENGSLTKNYSEELELDEAKRGRPRKDGSTKPAGSDDEEGGREHIIVQLRKAENLRGSDKHVEFNDNSRHVLNPAHVKKALDMHSGMKPSEKETFEKRLASSHASFTSAVKGEPAPKPKPKISLGGKMHNEAKDLNAKNVKAAVKHDCATHVEHAEFGEGRCIPEMHTIEEISEGVGYVTHYDIMFEHGIEQNVPVESLRILASEEHGHTPKKSMKEALIGGQKKIDANHNGKVDGQDFAILRNRYKKFRPKRLEKVNEAEEMTAAAVKAAADTQYAKGQQSKENMQQDSINKMRTDPLASKENVTLPPTQGNKPIGGDTEDPSRVSGQYSMEEERLINLFNSLSEENQEKFEAMIDTEEGLAQLLDFAEKQGF
jgi:hypothetical protein